MIKTLGAGWIESPRTKVQGFIPAAEITSFASFHPRAKAAGISAKGIKKNKYGLEHKRVEKSYVDLKSLYLNLKTEGVFKYPVDNFSRFDQSSKLASIAIALAFDDAGIDYAKGKKQEIGVLAANENGALGAQTDYFKDYVDNGRLLGRGNLFIYTLSSSPLAEAAIHFGLAGALLYLGFPADLRKNGLIEYAEELIKSKQAKAMLVLNFTNKETACSLIGI